jgi:hypothetical protein
MFEKQRQSSDPPKTLIDIVRQVRQRWRLKLVLRGVVSVLATVVLLTLVAAYGLEWARFSGASIVAARILIALAVVASVAYFLVRPLMRRVTDDQVALYLEEREPSLQAALMSAVEASRTSPSIVSTALVQRLVEQAVDRCVSTDAARRVERTTLRRYAATLGGVALVATAIFLLGPAFLRHAVSAMLLVSRSLEAAAPYRIDVSPGNATVPRGADQTISARLHGFESEDASLMVRRSPTTAFEPLPLVRNDKGQYEGMLFHLPGPLDYFVEAGGVRSAVYTLKVLDLPYVQRLELEYHFPSYTGLEPQKIEDGGDIAVLRGTEVRLRVIPTMKALGGRVVMNDKESVPLGSAEELTGLFKVARNGFYRIELDAPTGEKVSASPQYTIDVLTDKPPAVSFAKPGRDTTASPIEEVFVEATAVDDYGVRDLELVYSVNGGAEKTLKLFGGRNRLPEVTAGHTFYLEELNVQPGDSVSYFARAADNDAIEGAKRATSDLYFVRVRPFKKDFRQAASMAGGAGGGGGMGGQVDALSEQQRQIIAATFNVQRDRRTFTAGKLKEHTTVVALSQARLREQVEGLVTRMNSRLVEPDPSFKKIAELLPQAVTEMKQAEAKLGAASPDGALPPEHRALGFLQKAEEEYETQVSTSRNAGGGGGGSQMAQELADLFELELDRMANQYETADRAMQQNTDQQLDELLEKLKELARRQEQEAEAQRRRALQGQLSGGSGAQQRALAEQAEEAARRLERLSRDEKRPELMESARRLREAADAMRKAAASGDANAGAQAAAALERLRETEKKLQRTRTARSERDVKDALRQAEELAREQQSIAEGVRGMTASGDARREQARQLSERKDTLEAKLGELEQQLDRGAAEAASDEREASRKMSDAARGIRDNRLRDKIRYSKAMISRGAQPDAAQAMESDISQGFDALKRKLGEAASALGQTKPDSKDDALDKARRLARGMESLEQRMREQARSGQGKDSDKADSKGAQGSKSSDRSQGSKGSQGSQQSQGSQGGQGGDAADGSRDANGSANGSADGRIGNAYAGGGWDGGPWGGGWWGFNPDDIRQWRGEIRQWTNEVQDLRRMLRTENLDPKELDAILKALRELDDERVYKDLAELTRLQTFVTEGLKRFEYGLRRKVDANNGDVLLSGADEVPEEFKTLVAEYYRSLAKAPK